MSGIIGRIYKITSNETDYIYIGSTTQQLNVRFQKHKVDYKRHSDNKSSYLSSFEIVKYTDAKIELIHEGLFEGRNDLENYERDTIRTSPSCVNIYKKQTDEDLKENKRKCNHKYHEQNKDKINEHAAQYYEQNKEHYKQYREQNIEKAHFKYVCEICKGKFTHQNKSHHLKSPKHISALVQ